MKEFNIIIGEATKEDIKLFFGEAPWVTEKRGKPEPKIEVLTFPITMKFNTLLREIGVFASSSQAFREGWKDIPWGFTDVTIGKLKNRVVILKLTSQE